MDETSNRRANYVSRIQDDTHRIVRELMNENEKLRVQLDETAREIERYTRDFAQIERRVSDLANLYVSSYQLHGTLDREAVLTAIKEIVINLIGCEELALFEMNDERSALELVTSFGIDEKRFRSLAVASDPIAALAARGDMYIAGRSPAPAAMQPIVACVPLKLDARVTGALVLFSLLGHKNGLQELDYELLELLGTHAATALYCTGLHARVTVSGAP